MSELGESTPGKGGPEPKIELHPYEARKKAIRMGRDLTWAFLDNGLIQRVPTHYKRGYDNSTGYEDEFVVPGQVKQALKDDPVWGSFYDIVDLQVTTDRAGSGRVLKVRGKDGALTFSLEGKGRVGGSRVFEYYDNVTRDITRYDYDVERPTKPNENVYPSRSAQSWSEIEPHAQKVLEDVNRLQSKFAPKPLQRLTANAKRAAMRATSR